MLFSLFFAMFLLNRKKLFLENFIFFRAAQLAAPIDSIGGQLVTPCLEPYLQVSIYLYNEYFGEAFTPPLPCLPLIAGGVKNGWILPGK